MTYPLVIAVDGPTGLNYDTGAIDPLTLPADVSVTFAYPKIGHTRFPGADVCGELIVADIGIDPQLAADIDRELADPALIRSLLPARPRSAHKGTFGKVLIVSGSTLYTGAPVLAAEAAYRSGAGLVTLATPQSIHAIMASKINEATFLPLPDRDGVISEEAAPIILSKLADYTVTLIGPGLTIEARGFMEQLLDRAQRAARVGCGRVEHSGADRSVVDARAVASDFDAASRRDGAADQIDHERD